LRQKTGHAPEEGCWLVRAHFDPDNTQAHIDRLCLTDIVPIKSVAGFREQNGVLTIRRVECRKRGIPAVQGAFLNADAASEPATPTRAAPEFETVPALVALATGMVVALRKTR
jgi:hypothetical protein